MQHPHIQAWFDLMPPKTVATTLSLLEQVQQLRSQQVIYPAQENILNALQSCAPSQVKVVILGQDPYHEPGQAMGLAFSVPEGQKLPPSLRNMYKEMEADLSCPAPTCGDLSPWAKQGVLLLNTTLTVQEHEANSHAKLGWKAVTSALVEACMTLPQPVMFLGWGKHAIGLIEDAREKSGEAAQNKGCLFSTHPSPLSANRSSASLEAFMGSRPYSRTNAWLEAQGQPSIHWESAGKQH